MRIRTLPKNSDKEEEGEEERQRRLRRKARRREEGEEERESGLRREPLMLQRGSTVPVSLTNSAAIFSSLSLSKTLYRFGVISKNLKVAIEDNKVEAELG